MTHRPPYLSWAWYAALAVFVLAGSTGVLYRIGLTYGWTGGFDLVNIRHAHSHLMYFGWVTPVLFALIARQVARSASRSLSTRLNWILAGCFAAAVVSYPLFLLFGYTPVAVGDSRLPIAVIGSTLNMVAWWAFAAWYLRATRGLARGHGQLLLDAALVFLVFSTLGALGLALLKPLGVESLVWSSALTHLFVDSFAEGWFVLGVLGLAHAALLPGRHPGGHWSLYPLLLGVPLTFALGMPSALVPPGLRLIASAGGTAVALALLVNVVLLWPAARSGAGRLWRIPLVLLALKAAAQLAGSALPGVWWADVHGMRILYLHLMLLGFVTLGLVPVAAREWGRTATVGGAWLYATVCGVLISLVPLTPMWPEALGGRWAYEAAVWVSAGPVLAALAMLLRGTRRPHEEPMQSKSSVL